VECFFFFLKKEKKFLTDAGLRVREWVRVFSFRFLVS
jgi:hypothetical protein